MDVIPEAVMEAVRRTSNSLDEFEAQFAEIVALCKPEVLARLDPLERAQSLLLLAKATTTLYTLNLRCSGVHPDDHPVKLELERLSLYQEKLERFIDLSKAPLRPSATLNSQAATRFIEHSLPHLTPEQRQSMREISRGEGPKMKYLESNVHKKRKCQSTEKQSVRTAAQDFLEKAARELLGDNKGGFKGPLQPQDSDGDHLPVIPSLVVSVNVYIYNVVLYLFFRIYSLIYFTFMKHLML
ncbi:hypothetical protein RJ639_029305 [Escallonia herrerae]|uniref:Nuclear nucleic acid-binding protein C1D n=1 Tax=Escallonia herrerae TaxID=1293975 RepID=A0AA88X469_9ASTE|nr:hypothetical protein RJ639_029305 [Escallonia herrerae]